VFVLGKRVVGTFAGCVDRFTTVGCLVVRKLALQGSYQLLV